MLRVEVERAASVWGYQWGQRKEFIKIVTALPNYVATARSELKERGRGLRRGYVTIWW